MSDLAEKMADYKVEEWDLETLQAFAKEQLALIYRSDAQALGDDIQFEVETAVFPEELPDWMKEQARSMNEG